MQVLPLPDQLDHVYHVEMHVKWRHDFSFLQVFKLLAIQVFNGAEVGAEFCQSHQHDACPRAVVVVDVESLVAIHCSWLKYRRVNERRPLLIAVLQHNGLAEELLVLLMGLGLVHAV